MKYITMESEQTTRTYENYFDASKGKVSTGLSLEQSTQ